VDNGLQTSTEPFKAPYRKAFNGMCLVILKTSNRKGRIDLAATSDGLKGDAISIETR
jgi:beta-galactosidase